MSEIEGIVWCLVFLIALLGALYYVDIRVAAMPRLKEPPLEPGEPSAPGVTTGTSSGAIASVATTLVATTHKEEGRLDA